MLTFPVLQTHMGKNCNYHFLSDKDKLYSLLAILQTKAMWLCLTIISLNALLRKMFL